MLSGHNIGVVSIPNLSTLLHVIEIPSSNLVDQTRHSDKEEQFLSLKTFIKSYGADNLFKVINYGLNYVMDCYIADVGWLWVYFESWSNYVMKLWAI